MLTSPEELKAARDMLPPQVAADVQQAIDAEVSTERSRAIAAAPDSVHPYSAATLFLADKFDAQLPSGRFTGRPTVQWNGMDSFVFLEDRNEPFSYTTGNGRLITPKRMSTDGGSIPQIHRALRKFSPWSYGPGFIVHDWLFSAHHANQPPDNDWAFEATATALAECIKSLMERGLTNAGGATQKLEKAEDIVLSPERCAAGHKRGRHAHSP
jgi:hypothetical protein